MFLQQRSAEYVKLNPMAQVPSLVIDGVTLTQSVRDVLFMHLLC